MQIVPLTKKLDFAALEQLAKTDPEGFEAMRKALLESIIQPGERGERMRQFQWRIDMELTRSKNPLNACVRLSSMMWESVHRLDAYIQKLSERSLAMASRKWRPAAKVIAIHSQKNR